MAEITLRNYKESLKNNHPIKSFLVNLTIIPVMITRFLFRCVLAPIQSLTRIWEMKISKIARIGLCILSSVVSLAAYSAIAAACLGTPLLSLFTGKVPAVIINLTTHVSHTFSFKVYALLHKYVLGKVINEIILASRILVSIFFLVKEVHTFLGHEDLRDKSILRSLTKTVKGWFF